MKNLKKYQNIYLNYVMKTTIQFTMKKQEKDY